MSTLRKEQLTHYFRDHPDGRKRQQKLGQYGGQANGHLGGRPKGYTDEQARRVALIRQRSPTLGVRKIARITGLSKWQVGSILDAGQSVR